MPMRFVTARGGRALGEGPGGRSVCTSINEIICHGIPSTTALLKEGDIINIDVTCYYNGFHGDCRRGRRTDARP